MRGRKLGRGCNVGLNSGARRRCEGEREGGGVAAHGGEGGVVTQARAQWRWAPIGRRGSACREETGEGHAWAGPGEKERKMGRAQQNSEFFYLFK
jgi:hypothetical protein